MIAGNVYEEHPSGLCPSSMNGVWKVALSDANTISNRPRIVTEIPTAGPLMAAISGLGKSMNDATNLLEGKKRFIRIGLRRKKRKLKKIRELEKNP